MQLETTKTTIFFILLLHVLQDIMQNIIVINEAPYYL